MRYLDSSVPLAVILYEPRDKVEEAERIMISVRDGAERVFTTVFTVAEIYHVLERAGKSKNRIKEILEAFLGCSGLKIVSSDDGHMCAECLEISRKYDVDFVDAHHLLTMRRMKIKEIYSLDRHFDRFRDVKRVERVR